MENKITDSAGTTNVSTPQYCLVCGGLLPGCTWSGINPPKWCECPKTPVDPVIKNVYYNYGWICPVCGAGLSPFTSQCPCKFPTYKITC
jgi:hypothetical protein